MNRRKEILFQEQKKFIDELFAYTDSCSMEAMKLSDNDCYTEDSEVLADTDIKINRCLDRKTLAENIIRFCKEDPMTKERLFMCKWLFNEGRFRREDELSKGLKGIGYITTDVMTIIKAIGMVFFPAAGVVGTGVFAYFTVAVFPLAPFFTVCTIAWMIASFFFEVALIQDVVKRGKDKSFMSPLRLKGYLREAVNLQLYFKECTKYLIVGGNK